MANIWATSNMDFIQAKELVGDLMALCEDSRIRADDIIEQHERDDYAEAIRVVLEYLP